MPDRITFTKEDIGGEVLAILTTGLYRDPLDTLREYIQNAIDAECEHIELFIDPDTISVTDDGTGMTREQARRAIRLGISDKSPLENVGFRGIGIYSAFNLCNDLAIYTRSAADTQGYVIRINFKLIREELLKEQERRKRKQRPALYLEKLLESSVYVAADADGVVAGHGTKAVLSGLQGGVYKRLNDWEQVEGYLQNVVPLPFRPDFKYGRVIEKRLRDEAQRIVPVTLQVLMRRKEIYRPYYDGLFARGGTHPPKFLSVGEGHQRFGVAWVCINDARQVLRNHRLRGLLIKKFGFSIADRNFLEPLFRRPVFNRRITGEVIVEHRALIPNAARSDFEHNSTQQAFMVALGKLTADISAWGDRIQQEDKAREVLDKARARGGEINTALPSMTRDQERLLRLHVELDGLTQELNVHAKVLKAVDNESYQETRQLLKECQDFVEGLLVDRRRDQKSLERKIVRSIQRESAEGRKPEPTIESPENVLALLDSYDFPGLDEWKEVVRYLDETVLQARLSPEEYREMLGSLREFLDERA